MCQLQPGQGAGRAGACDAAGPPGEGAAAGRHQRSEAANAFLPGFVESYNSKFAQPPARIRICIGRCELNDLGDILCWRETRRVSRQLVVHYNRMKFTLHPTRSPRGCRGRMVEIYDFPDGRLEIRWKGLSLPYSAFDKLQRVSHAAIVENKRLGEVLAWIKEQQDQQPRFNTVPKGPRRSSQKSGLLKLRAQRIAGSRSITSKILPPKTAPLRYDGLRGAYSRALSSRPYDLSTLHDP